MKDVIPFKDFVPLIDGSAPSTLTWTITLEHKLLLFLLKKQYILNSVFRCSRDLPFRARAFFNRQEYPRVAIGYIMNISG